MKCNASYDDLARNLGVDEIYMVQPGHYTATTVLAIRENQKITVSDILKATSYLNDFIKAEFDVTNIKYSKTLDFLKTVHLIFTNHQAKKPTKEYMHYVIDVIHEVTDMRATCSGERRLNAKIALAMNVMIDMFGPTDEK